MASDISIYNDLKARLIGGEFPPGFRLRSDIIKQDYNVSANTVREVLLRLSTVGLVDFFEQRGFRVPLPSRNVQSDLAHMRLVLETRGAHLSIEFGGIAWEARLLAAHHELKHIEERAIDSPSDRELFQLWAQSELKFHRTLIDECASPILIATHEQIYQRFRQQLIYSDRKFNHVKENVAQHQAILDAVITRDTALVAQRIYEHMRRHLDQKMHNSNSMALP